MPYRQRDCPPAGPSCSAHSFKRNSFPFHSIDFVTTISWLFIVSNDKNRTDCNRQKKELESYCSALRIGTVQEMLFYILKENGGGTYEFYE